MDNRTEKAIKRTAWGIVLAGLTRLDDVLGLFERLVGWVSGANQEDAGRASENAHAWWRAMRGFVSSELFAFVVAGVGALVIVVAWIQWWLSSRRSEDAKVSAAPETGSTDEPDESSDAATPVATPAIISPTDYVRTELLAFSEAQHEGVDSARRWRSRLLNYAEHALAPSLAERFDEATSALDEKRPKVSEVIERAREVLRGLAHTLTSDDIRNAMPPPPPPAKPEMFGVAAYVEASLTGGVCTIVDAVGVDSITDMGVGRFRVGLDPELPGAIWEAQLPPGLMATQESVTGSGVSLSFSYQGNHTLTVDPQWFRIIFRVPSG